MARSGSIVSQAGAARETEGLGEIARFRRDLGRLGVRAFYRKIAGLGSLKQPRDLAQREAIEDEYGLGSRPGSPPGHERGARALYA